MLPGIAAGVLPLQDGFWFALIIIALINRLKPHHLQPAADLC